MKQRANPATQRPGGIDAMGAAKPTIQGAEGRIFASNATLR